jgi:hypothetical protein
LINRARRADPNFLDLRLGCSAMRFVPPSFVGGKGAFPLVNHGGIATEASFTNVSHGRYAEK